MVSGASLQCVWFCFPHIWSLIVSSLEETNLTSRLRDQIPSRMRNLVRDGGQDLFICFCACSRRCWLWHSFKISDPVIFLVLSIVTMSMIHYQYICPRKTYCFLKKIKNTIFKYQRTYLEPVKTVILFLLKYKTLAKNMSLCLEGL
jgi:hypothetical protein